MNFGEGGYYSTYCTIFWCFAVHKTPALLSEPARCVLALFDTESCKTTWFGSRTGPGLPASRWWSRAFHPRHTTPWPHRGVRASCALLVQPVARWGPGVPWTCKSSSCRWLLGGLSRWAPRPSEPGNDQGALLAEFPNGPLKASWDLMITGKVQRASSLKYTKAAQVMGLSCSV